MSVPRLWCWSSSSGSRFQSSFTHALPRLGASREAAFLAGAGPPAAFPQDYCQISVDAVESVESGWAVCPWWSCEEVVGWSRRGEAKRSEGEIPQARIWAGLGCTQVNKESSSRTGKTTSMATGINVTDLGAGQGPASSSRRATRSRNKGDEAETLVMIRRCCEEAVE